MISQMYINPVLVTMTCAMLMAFIAVGGLLWKLAGRLTKIEVTLETFGKQLNGHIADCAAERRRN